MPEQTEAWDRFLAAHDPEPTMGWVKAAFLLGWRARVLPQQGEPGGSTCDHCGKKALWEPCAPNTDTAIEFWEIPTS